MLLSTFKIKFTIKKLTIQNFLFSKKFIGLLIYQLDIFQYISALHCHKQIHIMIIFSTKSIYSYLIHIHTKSVSFSPF